MSGHCWAFGFFSNVLMYLSECRCVIPLSNSVPLALLLVSFVSCSSNSYPHGVSRSLYVMSSHQVCKFEMSIPGYDHITTNFILSTLSLYGVNSGSCYLMCKGSQFSIGFHKPGSIYSHYAFPTTQSNQVHCLHASKCKTLFPQSWSFFPSNGDVSSYRD